MPALFASFGFSRVFAGSLHRDQRVECGADLAHAAADAHPARILGIDLQMQTFVGDVVERGERGERGESEGRGSGRSDIAATAARSRSGARSAAMSAARFGDRTGRGARRSQRASIGNIGTSWILRVPVQASVSPPGRKGRMARQGTRESGPGREDSAAAVSPQAAWPPRATASDCCGSDRPPGPRCRSPDHPAAHG